MSSESPETPAVLAEISQGPSAFEQFLDRNQKALMIVAIAIALGTAAYVIISGIEKSQQETAGAALVGAEEINDLTAVISEHADTRAAQSASVILANQQWEEGNQDEAIATLEAFINENPDHPAAPTAKASLASKWMANGKSAEAVSAFQELIDNPTTRHIAPYALICIGDIAKAAGDPAKAKDSYTRVTAEFPKSNLISTANSRLSTLDAAEPTVIDPPQQEEATAPDSLPVTNDPSPSETSAPEAPAKSDS